MQKDIDDLIRNDRVIIEGKKHIVLAEAEAITFGIRKLLTVPEETPWSPVIWTEFDRGSLLEIW